MKKNKLFRSWSILLINLILKRKILIKNWFYFRLCLYKRTLNASLSIIFQFDSFWQFDSWTKIQKQRLTKCRATQNKKFDIWFRNFKYIFDSLNLKKKKYNKLINQLTYRDFYIQSYLVCVTSGGFLPTRDLTKSQVSKNWCSVSVFFLVKSITPWWDKMRCMWRIGRDLIVQNRETSIQIFIYTFKKFC